MATSLKQWCVYVTLGFITKQSAIEELQKEGYTRREICEKLAEVEMEVKERRNNEKSN